MGFDGTGKIWMNGKLVPWNEATIHVGAHVIHYGSALFEGIRMYHQEGGKRESVIFRLREHIQRLYNSAKIYGMTPDNLSDDDPHAQSGQFLRYSVDEIMDVISSRYELEPLGPSGPARDYRVRGFKGWVGFISPVSHPFCGECNRLRITAKGEIRPCLLWDKVVDVKGPMRRGATDGELVKLILDAVALKPRGHGLASGLCPGGVMAHIGG